MTTVADAGKWVRASPGGHATARSLRFVADRSAALVTACAPGAEARWPVPEAKARAVRVGAPPRGPLASRVGSRAVARRRPAPRQSLPHNCRTRCRWSAARPPHRDRCRHPAQRRCAFAALAAQRRPALSHPGQLRTGFRPALPWQRAATPTLRRALPARVKPVLKPFISGPPMPPGPVTPPQITNNKGEVIPDPKAGGPIAEPM